MIFWVICGNSVIDINTMEVFIVSFTLPAMTEAEFFGEKIVENLAGFLDLDPSKVNIYFFLRNVLNVCIIIVYHINITSKPCDPECDVQWAQVIWL